MRQETAKGIVRRMNEEDIGAVVQLDQSVFLHPWTYEMMRDARKVASNRFLMAEYNHKAAGFCCIALAADECELLKIAVAKECRRQGVARQMLEKAIWMAREQGAQCMFLEVRASNEPAKALYRRFGFLELGVRKNYYQDLKEDALVMRCEFADNYSEGMKDGECGQKQDAMSASRNMK